MKKNIIIIFTAILLSILFIGCEANKSENIVFTGKVEAVNASSFEVTTSDAEFDRAVVGYGDNLKINFNISAGQELKITILPEIAESYPVQVTAVKIELLKEEVKVKYIKITSKQAKEMMDNEDVIILDVRTLSEYTEGHIPEAILVPVTEIEEKIMEKIPDIDAKILVYCRSGNRSATASKTLIDLGYTNVYDFGGINNWDYEVVID